MSETSPVSLTAPLYLLRYEIQDGGRWRPVALPTPHTSVAHGWLQATLVERVLPVRNVCLEIVNGIGQETKPPNPTLATNPCQSGLGWPCDGTGIEREWPLAMLDPWRAFQGSMIQCSTCYEAAADLYVRALATHREPVR
jgi:hypothetical protein